MREAIEESEYTPNGLATKMKISAPSVAAWIGAANIKPAQNIHAAMLFKACNLLGVNAQWVVTGRGPKKGRLTTDKDASEEKVNPGLSFASDAVQQSNTANAEELKKEINRALADEGLSDELLTAIAWMIRAGTRAPVRGDQHHTKMVKLEHGQGAAKRRAGTK